MDQQVKQWIDYAAQDLGVARHLFENYHPKPLEIVCYHCQQSAEKAIKAVIVSLHWFFRRTRFPAHAVRGACRSRTSSGSTRLLR